MDRACAKRRAAIAAMDEHVAALTFSTSADHVWRAEDATGVAVSIRSLARLGRAPAWRQAIETWATITESRAEDPSGFELAYLVGSKRAMSVA